MCQITIQWVKQSVNKHDIALHVETFVEDGQTFLAPFFLPALSCSSPTIAHDTLSKRVGLLAGYWILCFSLFCYSICSEIKFLGTKKFNEQHKWVNMQMSHCIILQLQHCSTFCNYWHWKSFSLLYFLGRKLFVTRSPPITVQLHITKVVTSLYNQLHHMQITQMDRNNRNRQCQHRMSWFPFLYLRRPVYVFILWWKALWFAYWWACIFFVANVHY